MMITGRSGAIRFSSACNPCPLIPAIRRSEISTSGRPRSMIASASFPECAPSGRYPAWRRMSDSALTMAWSSSTTSTVAFSLCAPLLPGSPLMFNHLARCDRNRDHEPRPRRPRAEGYLAAVLAHYRLAYCETHPRALARLLGGEEGREQAALVFGSDPPPRFFEGERHARAFTIVFRVRGHAQCPSAAIHRVERIHDHVHEHLLELIGVAIHHQRIFPESSDCPDSPTRGFRLQKRQRAFGDGSQVADRLVRFALARVIQQHPHDPRDPIDLAHYYAQLDPRVRRRRLFILESLRAHAYHSHRRSDLVCESGG